MRLFITAAFPFEPEYIREKVYPRVKRETPAESVSAPKKQEYVRPEVWRKPLSYPKENAYVTPRADRVHPALAPTSEDEQLRVLALIRLYLEKTHDDIKKVDTDVFSGFRQSAPESNRGEAFKRLQELDSLDSMVAQLTKNTKGGKGLAATIALDTLIERVQKDISDKTLSNEDGKIMLKYIRYLMPVRSAEHRRTGTDLYRNND